MRHRNLHFKQEFLVTQYEVGEGVVGKRLRGKGMFFPIILGERLVPSPKNTYLPGNKEDGI